MNDNLETALTGLSPGKLDHGRGMGLYDCSGHQRVLRYQCDHEGDIRDARTGETVGKLLRDPETREHIICQPGRKPLPFPKVQPTAGKPPSVADRLYGDAKPQPPNRGNTLLTGMRR